MSRPFLSPAWFDLASAATSDLTPAVEVGYRVGFEAVDGDQRVAWHQVVEGGRVVSWALGSLADPDLVLRWSTDVARSIHRGEISGTAALEAGQVVVPGTDRLLGSGRPSPLDILDTVDLDRLPETPGASLVIQYVFERGPFGAVDYWWSFEDGRSSGMGLGTVEEPDVRVGISFSNMVAVRAGEMTILEALEGGGTVSGEIGPLMLLGGLEESPAVRAAESACGPTGPVLAAMGELRADPVHAAALAALAEETT